jgi:hypothetical protein
MAPQGRAWLQPRPSNQQFRASHVKGAAFEFQITIEGHKPIPANIEEALAGPQPVLAVSWNVVATRKSNDGRKHARARTNLKTRRGVGSVTRTANRNGLSFVVWWVEHRKAGRASASKIAWPRWDDTRTRQEDTETGAYQWSRCAGRQPARGRGSRTSPPGGWNGRFPGEKCRWSPASRSDRPIAEAKQGQWPTSAGVGSGTTARYRASSRYSVL